MTTETKTNVFDNQQQQIVFVDAGEVHWQQLMDRDGKYTSENTRGSESFRNPLSDLYEKGKRELDTSDGLVVRLSRGWDAVQGTIHVEEMSKEEVADAVKQRAKQVEEWKSSDDPLIVAMAETAAALWKTKPKYKANMGYRRGFAIPAAVHVRDYDEPGRVYQVSVQVVSYASPLERRLAHFRENEEKTAGASAYAPLDYILVAVDVVKEAGIEADLIRGGMKRGTAQKAYAIAKLDALFPSVKLVERLMKDEPSLRANQFRHKYVKGGFIPFGPLDKEYLRVLLKGKKARVGVNEEVPKATKPEEVEAYIKAAMDGVKRPVSTMARQRLIEGSETHACLAVREILDAILTDKQAVLSHYAERAEDINAALSGLLFADRNSNGK